MTARPQWWIGCDARECGTAVTFPALHAGEARRLARGGGWAHRRAGGVRPAKDYCPVHAAAFGPARPRPATPNQEEP